MSEDIKNQVIDQMKSAGSFALQLDQSTDISYLHNLVHSYVTFTMERSKMSFCAF